MYIGVALIIISLHVIIKTILVNLAKKDQFLTSPDIGRIKAQLRSGRIIRYIGNLEGLDRHLNEKTGEISYGKTWKHWWSEPLLWKIYGVRFIGLDSIRHYKINILKKEIDPKTGEIKIETEEKDASSIHLQGSYYRLVSKIATLETPEVNILLSFTTETVHAGESLKYVDWIKVVNRAIDSFTREFIAHVPLTEVNKIKAEIGTTSDITISNFVTELKETLNNSKIGGNPSLEETVGQEIIAVNIEMIDFVDKTVQEEAQAEEMAKRKMAARIAISEGEKTIALNEAAAKESLGGAENKILKGKLEAVRDTETLAQITKWENVGKLNTLNGTLIIGEKGSDQKTPIIIGSK
jgi:hypothetical protein